MQIRMRDADHSHFTLLDFQPNRNRTKRQKRCAQNLSLSCAALFILCFYVYTILIRALNSGNEH